MTRFRDRFCNSSKTWRSASPALRDNSDTVCGVARRNLRTLKLIVKGDSENDERLLDMYDEDDPRRSRDENRHLCHWRKRLCIPEPTRLENVQRVQDAPMAGRVGSVRTIDRASRMSYRPDLKLNIWAYTNAVRNVGRINHHSSVLAIIDHYTKMAHFITTADKLDRPGAAKLSICECVRLDGAPQQAVADRDRRWINHS